MCAARDRQSHNRGPCMRTRALSIVAISVLVAGAAGCGRSNDTAGSEDGGATSATATAGTSFGDLQNVCGPAPAGTTLKATDTGVTATSVQVSAFSDVGF